MPKIYPYRRIPTMDGFGLRTWGLACCWLTLTASALCADEFQDKFKFTGLLEYYYWTSYKGATNHIGQRARWLNLTAELPGHAKIVAGQFSINQLQMLDETYLELGEGPSMKFGRIRPAFGFSDWNEWYTGLIMQPFIRRARYSNFTFLQSMASGIEVSSGTPEFSYKVSALDGTLHDWQITPERFDRIEARVQTYRSGVIFGVNGLWDLDDSHNRPTRILGLDAWWTAPQIQFRAEYFKDMTRSAKGQGYHIDAFVKPYGWVRTSIVARAQSVSGFSPNADRTEMYTVGFKHDLNKQLSLDLNYGFGPRGPMSGSDLGWRAQIMSKIRF